MTGIEYAFDGHSLIRIRKFEQAFGHTTIVRGFDWRIDAKDIVLDDLEYVEVYR